MKGTKGFTLVELLIVLSIMGILIGISVPGLIEWRRNSEFKEAAQLAVSMLRQARGEAINLNQSIRVSFNLDTKVVSTHRVLSDGSTEQRSSSEFGSRIAFKSGNACGTTGGTLSITFNPTGSSNSGYLCIFDGADRKFRVGVSSSTTGRILMQRPDPANNAKWESI